MTGRLNLHENIRSRTEAKIILKRMFIPVTSDSFKDIKTKPAGLQILRSGQEEFYSIPSTEVSLSRLIDIPTIADFSEHNNPVRTHLGQIFFILCIKITDLVIQDASD